MCAVSRYPCFSQLCKNSVVHTTWGGRSQPPCSMMVGFRPPRRELGLWRAGAGLSGVRVSDLLRTSVKRMHPDRRVHHGLPMVVAVFLFSYHFLRLELAPHRKPNESIGFLHGPGEHPTLGGRWPGVRFRWGAEGVICGGCPPLGFRSL